MEQCHKAGAQLGRSTRVRGGPRATGGLGAARVRETPLTGHNSGERVEDSSVSPCGEVATLGSCTYVHEGVGRLH
jgi:hypothetical protein